MGPILDTARLRRLHTAGEGYIYNEAEGRGEGVVAFNLLHHASCRHVGRMSVKVFPRRGSNKYFGHDLGEAVLWLSKMVGPEKRRWWRCRGCLG